MAKRVLIVDSERCVGCQLCMYACARRWGEGGIAKSMIYIRSLGGIERGFAVIICRACEDPPCARVCPVDAISRREGGGVSIDPHKCIGCGLCVETCPFGAIIWDEESNKARVCNYCGYCVRYCPHSVLKFVEAEEVVA